MLGYEIKKVLLKSTDLSTTEIVDQVGCKYKSGWNKLNELEQLGLVKSKKQGRERRWQLTLEPPSAQYVSTNDFATSFAITPNKSLKVTCNTDGRVEQISSGDIIMLFQKTPHDIVCPHFVELKWANGCHFNCAWCYLQGTLRFHGKNAKVKDSQKIKKNLYTFFQNTKPELLNAGELSDSLCDPNIYYIIKEFESQNIHKLLVLTKSCSIKPLLKIENPKSTIVSFTVNSYPVAKKWEINAPPPENRLDAAKLLHDHGYPIRLRIDPIVPYPDRWESDYKDLIDNIFERFTPQRITLGTLRGLKSTIAHSRDKTWVPYLKDITNWGRKMKFSTRLNIYSTLLDYLIEKYNYSELGICKEERDMWEYLNQYGLDLENIKCNCTW